MVRIPTNRQPTHPGEILKEEFLDPMGLTSQQLAEAIHVSEEDVKAIINCHSNISEETALRLAEFFGTSPDFWINLQVRFNLYQARERLGAEIETITQAHSSFSSVQN